MVPTPTPAPPMPMQAMPAPMYFAATGSMFVSSSLLLLRECGGPSVARVNGVVEVDAGQDREHVGLQEGDQKLERGEDHDHDQRQRGAEPAGEIGRAHV